jgi:thymidylate synthase (FAD)
MTEQPQDPATIEIPPVTFRSDVTVELVDSMGTEDSIVRAARVSTKGAESKGSAADKGLIKYLYRETHGTPFESCILQWYFETPIFVDRQIMTHRIASTNGESGRYKELEGVFYVVPEERLLAQVGKVGAYEFVEGRPDQREAVLWVQRTMAEASWENYVKLKHVGIANEVARQHLPTTLYVSRYWTANLRSTLNFLSLRKDWGKDAVHASKAQYEIALMTEPMAAVVKEKFPTVWQCFVDNGYQAV